MSAIHSLPQDIWEKVLPLASSKSIPNFARSSRNFHEVVKRALTAPNIKELNEIRSMGGRALKILETQSQSSGAFLRLHEILLWARQRAGDLNEIRLKRQNTVPVGVKDIFQELLPDGVEFFQNQHDFSIQDLRAFNIQIEIEKTDVIIQFIRQISIILQSDNLNNEIEGVC